MIESIVHKAFDIFMWMLIEPEGHRAFFVIDGFIIILSAWLLWHTRDWDT